MILHAGSDQVSRTWMPACVCAMRSAANSRPTLGMRTAGSMATRPAIRVRRAKPQATTVSYSGFDSGSENPAPYYEDGTMEEFTGPAGWRYPSAAAVNGDVDSALFRQVVKTAPPRLMQLALKFTL